MTPIPRKQKTISQRLKEVQDFIGATPEQMAFILGVKEQMYKRYIRGNFDNTYSIRHDRLLARSVYLDKEIDKVLSDLQELKRRFQNYGKQNGKYMPAEPEKSVGKSVRTPSSNGHNLKEKG